MQNLWTGLVLHQLARPDPSFDPYPQLEALLTALVPRPLQDPPLPAEEAR